jgi:uncharacterized protein YjiS (DUF1127 family)
MTLTQSQKILRIPKMAALTDRFRDGSFRGHRQAVSAPSLWAKAGASAGKVVTRLMVWHDRARERRALLGLNDLQLSDIGISRADAGGEGDKPFWRA